MTTRVSLDGAWQLKGYYGMDWRWRGAHKPDNRDSRAWIPATVPGTVQHDLWQAGEIPNPYFERNSLLIEWVPARTWVYRKTFTVDPALQSRRALLRFEGIDYEAQIFLNGERLGQHTGMYTPAVFDAGRLLNYDGDNTLAVVIEPAPHEQPQVGRTSLVHTHKSRMTYWWDFCPRMVHVGIWDSAHIDFSGALRVADVFVRSQLNADFTQADIALSVDLDAAQEMAAHIEADIRHGDEIVAATSTDTTLAPGQSSVELALQVAQPKLWYPNGYGDPPLYEAGIRVTAGDTVLDTRTVRFGIRRIELIANQTDDPATRSYTLMVNGQRVYIKGWNWVPMDVMYGVERPAKLERLLTLAQRAHVNLLRVWGGGLIEKEAFYHRCDELGILVWQEFIQSSSGIDNMPPADAAYIATMVGEAEQIIPRRRNHPSLALWCGGNELTGEGNVPLNEAHPLLAALRDIVTRLDPDRLWLPTSPSGRVFSNSLEELERDPTALHDVHGPWEYQGVTGQQTLYNAGASLLHSEFGVEGLTNLKSLNATIAPSHQLPVSLDNPVWHHLAAWWVKEKAWSEAWGEITDVPNLVQATQYTQADGLRYALEANQRRKYQNSGTLPWQFNEPYPMAACTSAVDYYGQPKPSYYAVAHAYEPVHVSARIAATAWAGYETFAAEIWANSSVREPVAGARLEARIVGADGLIYAEQAERVTLPPDSAVTLMKIEFPLTAIQGDVFFLDLTLTSAGGETLSRNRYAFSTTANLAPLLNLPATTLTVESHSAGLTIRNTGAAAMVSVWLEDARAVDAPGCAYFSDNAFSLLPGEACEVAVTWESVPETERRLYVRGWNTNVWEG